MAAVAPIGPNAVRRYSGSATNVGAATDITVQVANEARPVRLFRVKLKHTAGSAAHITPLILKAAAAAAGSINQEWAGSKTGVANLFDVETVVDTELDATGALYLRPVPDVGADNAISWELYIEIGQ